MNIDINSLYRIGTGWVFDVTTNIGYKVERTGESRRGKVKRFIPAFELRRHGDILSTIYVSEEVPIGVIRKAMHMFELHHNGELEARHAKYY